MTSTEAPQFAPGTPEFAPATMAAAEESVRDELAGNTAVHNRRAAIAWLRNVWGGMIADDVAAWRTPWVGTVDKYRYAAYLDEAYTARALLKYTPADSPAISRLTALARIADADEAAHA
jgi:hypothetical protein